MAKDVTKTVAKTSAVLANACFPAGAMVNLDNGKTVRMNDLHTGNKVQAGMDFFSEINFMFMY